MKGRNSLIFWIFSIVFCVILIAKGNRKNAQLVNNYAIELNSGYVTTINSSAGGRGVIFDYLKNDSKYRLRLSVAPNCRKLSQKHLQKIQRYKFPVAYSKKNPSNAQILLFQSQYDLFNFEVPKNLRQIVELLSQCE